MRGGVLLFLAATAAAQGGWLERRLPGTPLAAVWRDMDGDGRLDLVYACRRDGGREIGWFAGEARGELSPEPVHRLRVLADVVLWSVADVDPAPGREILLFTPGSVFAYRPALAPAAKRYRRLCREELFFARADPERLPFWPAVRDVDGDGRPDLLVPCWGGYALRRTVRREEPYGGRVWFPAWLDRGRGEAPGEQRVEVRLGGGLFGGGPRLAIEASVGDLVRSVARMSVGLLADEDGDGRRDFLLLEGRQLKVWRQGPQGRFGTNPDAAVPVRHLLKERAPWRPYGNLLLVDLDGKGGLDFLVQEIQRRELRTRLLLFRGGLESLRRPDRILVLQGFAATPRVLDLNRDGRPDLLVPVFRLDVLSRLKRPAVTEVEVEFHVFLGRPDGRLPPRPDVSRTVWLRTEQLVASGVEPLYVTGEFNADGLLDLAFVTRDDRFQIYLAGWQAGGLFGGGKRFTYAERPAVTVPLKPPARLEAVDVDGDGLDEVAGFYGDRVRLWGFHVGEGKKQ